MARGRTVPDAEWHAWVNALQPEYIALCRRLRSSRQLNRADAMREVEEQMAVDARRSGRGRDGDGD